MAAVRVGNDAVRYEVHDHWGELPPGFRWGEAAAVCVQDDDRVLVFTRTEHPLMVFDRDGHFEASLSPESVVDPHGICLDREGNRFLVDRAGHAVVKVRPDGSELFEVGARGQPSDTGWTPEERTVHRAAGPFNWPTDVAMSSDGSFYVSDGYRNARVHKFASDGAYLFSWGEPGDGPGQFNLVHSVWEHAGIVYVADRQNHRIQLFAPSGAYLDEWRGFVQPTDIFIDPNGLVYVSELGGRVTLLDLEGRIVARIGSPDDRAREPGRFISPHGIWADRHGDFYVTETTTGQRIQKFQRL
jgi:NHL repeat-containing protein